MGRRKSGNGDGSVYQDGERWVAAITLGKSAEGRYVRKKVYCDTLKEAKKKRDELVRLREAGARLLTTKQTVRQYVDYWLDDVKAGQVRPGTLRVYRTLLETHVYPVIGDRLLARLKPDDVQTVINRVTKTKAPGTARLVLTIVRMVLETATQWELVSRNVAKVVDPPKGRATERHALTPAQARRLLQEAADMDDEGVYWAALLLGMRQGEILGLQWKDVDLETGIVLVRRTLTSTRGGEPAYGEPKSEAGRRTLYLTGVTRDVLDSQRRRQSIWAKEAKLSGGAWVDFDLVFTNHWGGPLVAATLRNRFAVLLKSAGLPDVHFHEMRHTHQSLLAELGVPERTSMDLLGHRDIETTRMVYTHSSEAGKQRAASQIGEVFADLRKAV